MTNLRVLLGLSLQRALLGAVSPPLRGVSVDEQGHLVHLRFFFDGEVLEEDREAASEIESEVLADLPTDVRLDTTVVRVDAPRPLPPTGFWAYRRREVGR